MDSNGCVPLDTSWKGDWPWQADWDVEGQSIAQTLPAESSSAVEVASTSLATASGVHGMEASTTLSTNQFETLPQVGDMNNFLVVPGWTRHVSRTAPGIHCWSQFSVQQEIQNHQQQILEPNALLDLDSNPNGPPCRHWAKGKCKINPCKFSHDGPGSRLAVSVAAHVESTSGSPAVRPPSLEIGDWACQNCGNVNYGFRQRCNRCTRAKL